MKSYYNSCQYPLINFPDLDDSEKSREEKKKNHVLKDMADLDSTSGRLIFKDRNRKLKADNFRHGLAVGLGSITLAKLPSDFHGKFELINLFVTSKKRNHEFTKWCCKMSLNHYGLLRNC